MIEFVLELTKRLERNQKKVNYACGDAKNRTEKRTNFEFFSQAL